MRGFCGRKPRSNEVGKASFRLDFLGFSRLNQAFSRGCAGDEASIIFPWFFAHTLRGRSVRRKPRESARERIVDDRPDRGARKRRIFMMVIITRHSLFRKRLSTG